MFPLLWFCVGLAYFEVNAAQDELKAVVVIYRHGDRTPIQPYPTDPYKNASYWPVGFGQLTKKGKHRHLDLGKWLRNRYDGFLPSIYSENDIFIRSTDVDRTLMSAEANLAGLYPPFGNQVWDEVIKWQPIPVHTQPQQEDILLAAKKPCPKYDRLLKQLFKSDYFRNISHQNHDLYAYLTRYSGQTVSDLKSIEYLYSTLLIETLNNYTLPSWAIKVFPIKLYPWASLSFATETFTPELARLKTGPLFNHIVKFFKNRTAESTETPKFLVFSAHDTTIANVLNTMGAFEYHTPPFASTIMMEMRKRSNGRSYVNLFYKNTSEPRQITLKHCDFNCDLVDFSTILKPIIINLEDWEIECKLKTPNSWPLNFEWNIILLCSILTVIFLAIGIIMSLKKTRKENETTKYIQLPNEEYS
nr:prostatic acid phosphatase-like [Leptinotarsa decemlineata]